jgi:hypothetical protein
MANNLTGTKWADHVRGCADLAREIAGRLDIRDDPARQAMLATIIISADRHNIFLEPIPERIAPVLIASELLREAAKADSTWRQEPPKGEVVGENRGALRNPTPEQAEGATRDALLAGISSARELLKMDGKQMNEYIAAKMKTTKTLGMLTVDELSTLTEKLCKRIDAEKAKAASQRPPTGELTDAQKEKLHNTNEALEDWP